MATGAKLSSLKLIGCLRMLSVLPRRWLAVVSPSLVARRQMQGATSEHKIRLSATESLSGASGGDVAAASECVVRVLRPRPHLVRCRPIIYHALALAESGLALALRRQNIGRMFWFMLRLSPANSNQNIRRGYGGELGLIGGQDVRLERAPSQRRMMNVALICLAARQSRRRFH